MAIAGTRLDTGFPAVESSALEEFRGVCGTSDDAFRASTIGMLVGSDTFASPLMRPDAREVRGSRHLCRSCS